MLFRSVGKYSVSPTSCAACTPGTISTGYGATQCLQCQVGTYSSIIGATLSCLTCEDGKYNNFTGQSMCFACSQYQRSVYNYTGCTDLCPFKLPSKATFTNISNCTFTCNTGYTGRLCQASIYPNYQYCETIYDCQYCPQTPMGYSCNNVDYYQMGYLMGPYKVPSFPSNVCLYRSAVDNAYIACPLNCPSTCPAGMYMLQCLCELCPPGYYCPGSIYATACPVGTYNSASGSSSATACSACTVCTNETYANVACSSSTNAQCQNCTQCKSGELELSPCNASTNRVCTS